MTLLAASLIIVQPLAFLFIFEVLLSKQWRLKACVPLTLPEPVNEKRFLTALFVFNLGILLFLFLKINFYDLKAAF